MSARGGVAAFDQYPLLFLGGRPSQTTPPDTVRNPDNGPAMNISDKVVFKVGSLLWRPHFKAPTIYVRLNVRCYRFIMPQHLQQFNFTECVEDLTGIITIRCRFRLLCRYLHGTGR